MLEDGVSDLVGNVNSEKICTPMANENDRVYVDNLKPRIILKDVWGEDAIRKENEIVVTLQVIDIGAGISEEQFVADDINVQVNGKTIEGATKQLIPSESNDHDSALGGDLDTNYTYELKISGINENGLIRLEIPANNIIDKANNDNEVVTLTTERRIDNEGPKVGMIFSNADEQNEVTGIPVIVTINDCVDDSGIAKYEWQISKNKSTWNTIEIDESMLSTSSVEQEYEENDVYYYRVIVSDTLGNTSVSDTVKVIYRNSVNRRITIKLTENQVNNSISEIKAVIKSSSEIQKITVNGSVIPESTYKNNVTQNKSEYTTTFIYEATNNDIYEFEATDSNGNTEKEVININSMTESGAIIDPKKFDATIFSNARIVFTSDVPFRIIDKNGYSGITFLDTNFATRVEAIISPDEEFLENRTFIFENKGLIKTEVEVEAPIITKHSYVRFVSDAAMNLNLTAKEIKALVSYISTAKCITPSGKVDSYYGFNKTNINIQLADENAINVAKKLGAANETYVLNDKNQKVKLEANESINAIEDLNYTNGNVSGMYEKTEGSLTSFDDIDSNNSSKYDSFRIIIIP